MSDLNPPAHPSEMRKLIHDLNNAMTGALAMSDLCLRNTPSDHPQHELLKIINDSAEKSRLLVMQISALNKQLEAERE